MKSENQLQPDALGGRLKELRQSKGLTQQALANASGINIRQIQRIEGGESAIGNLTLKNAVAIAHALGVTAEDLLKVEPGE